MKLVPNWRRVIKHAWSVRLLAIAGVLSGLEAAVPFLNGVLPIPPGAFAALAFLATGGAFVARLIAQQSVSGDDE